MDFQTNCEFSVPLTAFGGTPTSTFQVWNYQKLDCTTTYPAVSEISDGTNTFYLAQTWDYGTLFIAFLFVVCILVAIFKDVFYFLFHRFVRFVKSTKF